MGFLAVISGAAQRDPNRQQNNPGGALCQPVGECGENVVTRLVKGNPGRMKTEIYLRVDGVGHAVAVDARATVLDVLREQLDVTSVKKGCDHGQCGACTVLTNGRRTLSCLSLAVAEDGAEITTAAGLGDGARPHPVQRAFLDHDALQCGYCTPGQVCSAVGVLDELARGWPSAAGSDVRADPEPDRAEVAERMSGNLCRCGAYAHIVPAVLQAATEGDPDKAEVGR